jgi:hypothetical protein
VMMIVIFNAGKRSHLDPEWCSVTAYLS